jgi:FdrA protein
VEGRLTPAPVLGCAVRRGAYHDSVVLLGLQAALAALPGVIEAAVVMATPANLELLAAGGLLPPAAAGAGPADLLVVVRAESERQAGEALGQVEALLAARSRVSGEGFRPRSLEGAVKQLPAARWVVISVPGRYAARVAQEALDLGRHVFLFSDNVALAEEAALKGNASSRGLLVLGPDCGTALLGGVGLGFANRVRRGAIGLAGASGTGLQAVASEIHRLGAGVSQAIGTGGRDLAAEIGGVATAQALDLLRRDPETEVIVLLAKAAAPPVRARLLAAARETGKPVVVYLPGAPLPARRLGSLHFAAGSSDAAELAVALLEGQRAEPAAASAAPPTGPPAHLAGPLLVAPPPAGPPLTGPLLAGLPPARPPLAGSHLAGPPPAGPCGGPPAPPLAPGQRYLRGLFSGGSLAAEALQGLQAELGPIFANFTAPQALPLPDPRRGRSHTLVDLGDDALTAGRPHPMIDHDLLRRRLLEESGDPEVAAILLDVVLGDGAHPDPAGDLAPAIAGALTQAAAAGRGLEVLALVVGTDADPQGLAAQVEALAAAGARVFRTVEQVVDHACRRLAGLTDAGDATAAVEGIVDPPVRTEAAGAPAEAPTAPAAPPTAAASPVAAVPPVGLDAIQGPLAAINVGLESFYTSLVTQGAAAVQVDWRPPAGGDERRAALLAKMKRSGRSQGSEGPQGSQGSQGSHSP